MRRGRVLFLVLALLATVSAVWALSRPMQNGQDTMGATFLHAAYGGL